MSIISNFFAGDFSVRIFDLDTSDSFLLPMTQAKSTNDNEMKQVDEIKSLEVTQTRSILQRKSFDSTTATDEILETDEDSKLTMAASSVIPKVFEVFTCLAYCSENHKLCAGTNLGNLYIWKRNTSLTLQAKLPENGIESMENYWHLYYVANVRGAIKHCSWGICDVSKPCVLLNCISNVYILKVSFSFYIPFT